VRINSLEADRGEILRAASDLTKISYIASDKQERPCEGCRLPCACSQSPSCTCGCSSSCRYLVRRLSSDPDTFPLEAGIVPLVYALVSLRIATPCWSCEGHTNEAGELIKLPSVWFYSASNGLARLVSEHCNQLYGHHKIHHEWGVEILALGETMQTTYSLRPNLSLSEGARLADLREDVLCLAGSLFDGIKTLARDHLPELERALNND